MHDRLQTLTPRERETLHLLARGHDAKSIARVLNLSVHTIHERLRDARRKLDVSNSREAARLLADADPAPPQILGNTGLGVPAAPAAVPRPRPAAQEPARADRLVWFGGGMLIMSLVIAAAIFAAGVQGGSAPTGAAAPVPVTDAAQANGLPAATRWVTLLDRARWAESWQTAAPVFRTQITAAQWGSMIAPLRQSLGAVASRRFQSAIRTTTLQNLPVGEYEIVQFQTRFAQREAIETVVLSREGTGWKVGGYFIK